MTEGPGDGREHNGRQPNRGNHTRLRRVLWYVIPLSLLVFNWDMTTPPWAGPDEAAHYIKALGTVSADPVGRAANWTEPEIPFTPAEQAYFGVTSRRYRIPTPLAPRIPTIPCFALRPPVDAPCGDRPSTGPVQDISYVGTYQPLYYVLPGLAAHVANSAVGGLRAARLVAALEFAGVVALALALLDRDGTGPPVYGVFLVLTPMTLSLGGTMTASGFEAVTSMLFMCACVRLVESRRCSSRLLAVTVLAGTLLAWSRPLGPLWVGGALVLAVCLAGGRRLVELSKGRAVQVAALALAALTAASGGWDLALGFGRGTGRTSVSYAVRVIRADAMKLAKEQIGIFGWVDTVLPRPMYRISALLILAALIGAALVGRGRERLTLAVGVVFYLMVALVIVVTTATTGFALQGRYLLPAWALVAVVAGEMLRRGQERRQSSHWARRAGAIWVAVFAGLNVGAVYVNARRYAVGAGHSWLFFLHPRWRPAGGWIPWLIVLAMAGAALLFAATMELRPPPDTGRFDTTSVPGHSR